MTQHLQIIADGRKILDVHADRLQVAYRLDGKIRLDGTFDVDRCLTAKEIH